MPASETGPLTPDQVAAYLTDGILVVDLLTEDELKTARAGLADTLRDGFGVDVDDLDGTAGGIVDASTTNGAGGVLDVFYPKWKMDVATNESLFRITRQLWREAYFHSGEGLDNEDKADIGLDEDFKWHPFGEFDCDIGYMYIDRVGFRLPTELSERLGRARITTCAPKPETPKNKKRRARPLDRGLTPHFDCCPETYRDACGKTKWRPIQCFVSLTDNLEANTGGFEAVPGFHREFRSWVERGRRLDSSGRAGGEAGEHPRPCVGEYTHLSPAHDREILKRVKHIPVRAGSAVFWDNRIPHGNAYRNDPVGLQTGGDTMGGSRVVVYCSFLPDVEVNAAFVNRQLEDWRAGRPPSLGDRWIKRDKESEEDRGARCGAADPLILSELGKRLIGIVEW